MATQGYSPLKMRIRIRVTGLFDYSFESESIRQAARLRLFIPRVSVIQVDARLAVIGGAAEHSIWTITARDNKDSSRPGEVLRR